MADFLLMIALIVVIFVVVFIIAIIVTIVKAIANALRTRPKCGNDISAHQCQENDSYDDDNNFQYVRPENVSLPPDPNASVEELAFWELKNNSKIRAITLVREKTGCSLYDAKSFVENLEHSVPAHQRFSGTPQREDVSTIDGMEGHAFEHYCAQLLKKNGFTEVSITPGSGDQGVDVLATKDGIKYAVQCKNYASPLSNTPIQEVNAGKIFYNCHVGVVMTNSTFTTGAKDLARATGVLLWDRNKLQELISASNTVSQNKDIKQAPPLSQTPPPTQLTPAEIPVPKEPVTQRVSTPSVITSTNQANTFTEIPAKDIKSSPSNRQSVIATEEIDGVRIEVHTGSASALNLTLSNFGIDRDDDEPDDLTLLVDVETKNARGIPDDITIVCNAFAGKQKLATEHEYLYKDSFYWRDSLEVYFSKKKIATRATRIEIFCKRG